MAVTNSQLTIIAFDCAQRRYKHTCDNDCRHCPSNVSHYISDKKESVLFQHSINIEYEGMQQRKKEYADRQWHRSRADGKVGLFVLLFMFLPMIIFCIMFLMMCHSALSSEPEATNAYGGKPLVGVVNYVNQNIYDNSRWYTNGSFVGINCVDYAILFWSYCGGSNNPNVKVMRCHTPQGFDHLYIKYYGHEIEPTTGDDIETWWGSQYNKRYTIDITNWCHEVPLTKEGNL